MKRRTLSRRQRARKRPGLRLESLEPRFVLNGTMPIEIVDLQSDELKSLELENGSLSSDESTIEITTAATDQSNSGGSDSGDPIAVHQFASGEELQQYLLTRAIEQWHSLFGAQAWPYWPSIDVVTDVVYRASGGDVTHFADQLLGTLKNGPAAATYSNNNQVAGVDEGDIVKTDGEYLFVVGRENRLTIIDVRDPTDLKIASRLQLEEHPRELYISGDRLIVISNDPQILPLAQVTDRLNDFAGQAILPWPSYDPHVELAVYDIADRAHPTLISNTEIDGNLIQSRLVGDQVYLVTSDGIEIPPLHVVCNRPPDDGTTDPPQPDHDDPAAVDRHRRLGRLLRPFIFGEDTPNHPQPVPERDCHYETEEAYTARVTATLVEEFLPDVITTGPDGVESTEQLALPEQIYVDGEHPWQLVSTIVFDTSDSPAVTAAAGVMTNFAAQVYATADHVYVASSHWSPEQHETSQIYQFSIGDEGHSVELTAAGSVAGHLLNQFSMDEQEGHLRVATSQGWGPDSTSNLFVLAGEDDKLVTVGSITGIAPGESIFAARFLGDIAFLVTFERVDPLFAIDLSDPTNPVIAGELEISGFSNYLHPVDGGYLIGIGRDADDHGENRFGTDPQVSLFNVNDLSSPELVDRFTIDFEGWSWSPVFDTHQAVNFYQDAGILTVPFDSPQWRLAEFLTPRFVERPEILDHLPQIPPVVESRISDLLDNALDVLPAPLRSLANSLFGEGENGDPQHDAPKPGLWVFHIDPAAEHPIEALGTVTHDKLVLRSIRIGDVLFVISHDHISAHELLHPERQLDEIFLGRVTNDDVATVHAAAGPTTIDVLANDHVSEAAKIVAVSETTHGGHVEITADGRAVIYTPPPANTADGEAYGRLVERIRDLLRRDSFRYTVDTGDGITEQATVHVFVVPERPGQHMAELTKADLAHRLDIDVGSIDVLRVIPTHWPDSCLGAPADGEACQEVVTPGFIVWLGANGVRYKYHTDTESRVIFVEHNRDPHPDQVRPDFFRVEHDSSDNQLDVLANDFPGITFIQAPQITAVSETSAGGTVTIAEDGSILLYTPAAGFRGEETFTYTVDNGPSGKVMIHVFGHETPGDDDSDGDHHRDLVEIQLKVTDEEGNEITKVELGDTFYVNVYVDDLRRDAEGVFGAYFDVVFDQRLAEVAGELDFSDIYTNGLSGEVIEGEIDELGAFANSLEPLGDAAQLLVRIPFEATAAGQLRLSTNPADERPIHEVDLFGVNHVISQELVKYGHESIEIVNGWHNEEEPTDVNNDHNTTPQDALVVVNFINREGLGSLRDKIRGHGNPAERAALLAARMFYDVNKDFHLTPMDPLLVINRLNVKARELAESLHNAERTAHSAESSVLGDSNELDSGRTLPPDLGRHEPGQTHMETDEQHVSSDDHHGRGSPAVMSSTAGGTGHGGHADGRAEGESTAAELYRELLECLSAELEPRTSVDHFFAALDNE